jgi:hypothetical protein
MPKKFYKNDSWAGIRETTYELLTIIILVGVPYPKSNHDI